VTSRRGPSSSENKDSPSTQPGELSVATPRSAGSRATPRQRIDYAASTIGRRAQLPLSTIAALHLGLLILGAPVSFFAAFPLGMNVADAFGVSGELHTLWHVVLLWASGISLLALLALLFSTITTRQLATPSPEPGSEGQSTTIQHH